MSTKYCQHCGRIIGKECIICPECGKQVENVGYTVNTNATSSTMNPVSSTPSNNYNQSTSPKSKILTLLLAVFLGTCGIHRFYVGKIGSGILWFFTCGIFGIGWLYDIIKIASGTFKDGANRIISH